MTTEFAEPTPITRAPLALPIRRPRTDERIAIEGADACSDDELLGLVLGDGVQHRRLARRLLERFGSVRQVLTAGPVELRLAGVGERSIPRLAAATELGRRAARTWPDEPWVVRTPGDAAEPLLDDMGALEREELRVLLLDTKNVVTARRLVYQANVAGSPVRVGEVFRHAVATAAAGIIVVHNHPSGDPTPSADDLRITGELAEAGRLLDIEVVDHIVIGRGRWTSLRAVGALGQGASTMR